MSSLFILLQLLLGSLKLRTCWFIVFVSRDGHLNGNFWLSGVAIHFRKPLGNLGRILQMPPPFWLHIWSVEDYTHSQGGGDVSFWFSFVDFMLVYRHAYVFLRLYLDVHVVHIAFLCMLHCCASDMTAVMQSAAPIGRYPSIPWDHQCYE